ncbi:MAG: hypothetical protein C0518_00540 [Opitutus sp.]|nr:hypothetical protein [Opitutus sp.]
MDLLLIHVVLLIWLSVGAARRWTHRTAYCLLAAAAIAWANLVATALLLSPFRLFGQPAVLLVTSLALALGTWLVARRSALAPTRDDAAPLGWPSVFVVVVAAVGLASAAAAATFLPSRTNAIAYELPRALFQAGGGSVFMLQAADARQVLLPFNYGLLQTWVLVYQPPFSVLNFLSLGAWGLCGLAAYRLCLLSGTGRSAAVIAASAALLTTPVLAYASTADVALPVAASLLGSVVFAIDWSRHGQRRSAIFAGLLAGLAAGCRLDITLAVSVGFAGWCAARGLPREHRGAAALALAFGLLPFAVNTATALSADLPQLLASLRRTISAPAGFDFSWLQPLWKVPTPLLAPTEDSVGWGVPGLAILLSATILVLRRPNGAKTATWLAAATFVWVAAALAASRWVPVDSGLLFPALLLSAPALALGLDALPRPSARLAVAGVLVGTGLWSGYLYLWHNANQPLAALTKPALVAPATAQIPPLLALRVAEATRINFSSDGEDPLLFLLMRRQQQQRYAARGPSVSDAYNLISRSTSDKERPLRQLAGGPAYVMIAFPDKPTAGVEFLGRAGPAQLARDYFGLAGDAAEKQPIPADRTLLVTITQVAHDAATRRLLVDMRGLNPPDHARLEIWGVHDDGQRRLLATFREQGEQEVAASRDLKFLQFQIVGQEENRLLGEATLADYVESVAEDTTPADPRRLFLAELVSNAGPGPLQVSSGLTAIEGPFPQWQLPRIRWARAENITLIVLPTPTLARLRLRLDVRLHIRTQAILSVVINGEEQRRVQFHDAVTWHNIAIEFAARPGENIIELRDAPLLPEANWADYLERYPDVKRSAETSGQPLRETALNHYKFSGEREGRIMHFVEVPRPPPDAFFFMFRQLQVEGLRE